MINNLLIILILIIATLGACYPEETISSNTKIRTPQNGFTLDTPQTQVNKQPDNAFVLVDAKQVDHVIALQKYDEQVGDLLFSTNISRFVSLYKDLSSIRLDPNSCEEFEWLKLQDSPSDIGGDEIATLSR